MKIDIMKEKRKEGRKKNRKKGWYGTESMEKDLKEERNREVTYRKEESKTLKIARGK